MSPAHAGRLRPVVGRQRRAGVRRALAGGHVGLVLVDGGFIDLSGAPGATWEQIAVDLKPPPLAGTPRAQMMERMRGFHADWDDEQLEMQMANFETMEDGTIRPWLTLDRHMADPARALGPEALAALRARRHAHPDRRRARRPTRRA